MALGKLAVMPRNAFGLLLSCAAAFKKYERSVNRVMNLYLRFVSNWYKPHFAEIITHPVPRFQLPETVNAVLAGNLSNTFSIWWRMEIFYLVVFLQRFIPLCPRVSLNPQDNVKMPGTARSVIEKDAAAR